MLGGFNVKLGVDLKGLSAGLNKASGMLKNFGGSVKQAGQTLTRSLTVPITGAGTAMLKTAMDFEKAMNQVGAVTGAVGQDFEALRDQAKQLGSTTKFTATQAAEGMSFLAMAGFETEQIMTAMPGVLNLASAGAMDLATASDIASNILTGFNLDAEEMARVVDVMAKTFTSSNTNLMQLGTAMSFVAPVAAGFGVSIEETSAIIGMLSDAGIQASRAGTSLRGIMVQLGEASKELGFSLKDSSGQMRPMADILDDLTAKAGGTQSAIDMFGQRAGPGLVSLLQQGSDKLRQFEQELKDSGGTAEKIADRQMQGLAGALTELRSAVEGMFIAFADIGILKRVEEIVDSITSRVRAFTQATDEQKEAVVKLLAILAGLGPALIAVGTAIGIVAGTIALLGGPVTAIIAGVVAIVGVLYYLLDNWNAVVERMSDTAWWYNTIISMRQILLKINPLSLLLDLFLVMTRFVAKHFSDFFNSIGSGFYTLKARVLTILADIVAKASEGLGKLPFMDGWADTAEEFGKTLGIQAELAEKMAGTDFAGPTVKALEDINKVNPFRIWADSLDESRKETKEYTHEFKSLNDYVSQAGSGLLEMLGLSELLNISLSEQPTTDTEADEPAKVVDSEGIVEALGLFGRLREGFRDILNDTKLIERAYKSFGESIAEAFTRAIMTGKSLVDQLAELGRLLLGKGIQFAISTLLGGGLMIGGEMTSGFLGQGGGLFGSFLKAINVNDALITDQGKIVKFHPNDNILAMQNLGSLQGGDGSSSVKAFETALDNFTSRIGPDEVFILTQKGRYGF
jgi:TP901 family phage tail tape measure protein